MGRSKETFGKKEVRNKKEKKRKEKEKRRLERKEQGSQSWDDMIAYVDENGNISSTPPDLTQKEEVDAESIEIGVPKKEDVDEDPIREGIVKKFDDTKGYGFITDSQSKDSLFVHINDCAQDIITGNKVSYEIEKGNKGLKAINVRVVK